MDKKLILYFFLLSGIVAAAQTKEGGNGGQSKPSGDLLSQNEAAIRVAAGVDSLFGLAEKTKGVQDFIKRMNDAVYAALKLNDTSVVTHMRDAIQSRLNITTIDSDKVELLYFLASAYADTAIVFKKIREGILLSKKINYVHGYAGGLNTLGKEMMARGTSYYKGGTTYELVKDKFTCIHRGKIQAKNKGEIDMYFVEA